MTSGMEIRARIDSEQLRGLLLIHGGASIALLAFLPHILGKPEYVPLAKCILVALVVYQFGLLVALIHNRDRRICSLKYEEARANSPAHPDPCTLFGKELGEPCACLRSIVFMWLSVLLFATGGMLVAFGGMKVVFA